ncbi:Ig-like domain-containing protein [Niabella yanshanensis]|uniref:Ig-like domain-containing protein n=1 Tax=Niabella yanshanensis TaxID=577386 RepID=A0ABZ0W6N1_9BACT|nr:Ig-like domain-containing protein [Niabella yanshanensis]WQD38791.1 Ig-like domain-containing protein [Niabella yanshanensis]
MRIKILALMTLLCGIQSQAQNPTPVNCLDGLAYILTNGEGGPSLYSMALSATSPTLVGSLGTTAFNAIGYNASDNFMYAINQAGEVYRIGANSSRTAIPVSDPNSLLGPGYTAGDISANGVYYIYSNTLQRFVSIDLASSTPVANLVNYTIAAGQTLTGTIDDFVFHPSDGNIYGVTSTRQLFTFNVTTNLLTIKGNVSGTLTATGTKGTTFMDAAGNMYVGQNSNGTLYRIGNPAVGSSWTSTSFSTALASLDGQPFDGARCASVVPPAANNDERELTEFAPVTLDVINSSTPGMGKDGQGTYPLDVTSVVLYPSENGAAAGSNTIELTGKGTFTLNPSTGIVTFTPLSGFTGEAVIWYTVEDTNGNISNRAFVRTFVADGTVLPVRFDAFSALLTQGHLQVNWTTLSETENSHFDIEVSADGDHFKSIGTLKSQAQNGNSDAALQYQFTLDSNQTAALLGVSLSLSILAFATGRSRKRKWVLSALTAIMLIGYASCSKQDTTVTGDQALFVRIKQVDKDGKYTYSKVIRAAIK